LSGVAPPQVPELVPKKRRSSFKLNNSSECVLPSLTRREDGEHMVEKGLRMRLLRGVEAGKERRQAMLDAKSAKEWIDLCLDTKPAELRAVAEKFRKLVNKTVKGAKESVNSWKIPTFECNGPMCFFMVGKHHVTFGFLRGTSLPDPAGLLEETGKNLRHVKLRTAEDVRTPALRKLIEAAARLNKKEPMKMAKKTK
jgi:hypothetical protein